MTLCRSITFYILLFVSIASFAYTGVTADSIISKLLDIERCKYNITFNASIPLTNNEIHYLATVNYLKSSSDTLARCKYYITYNDNDTLPPNRFTMYFNGNYYRFEHNKLQEYHYDTDTIAFTSQHIRDRHIRGIQSSGIFTPYLPCELAQTLLNYRNNSDSSIHLFNDTIISGNKYHAVSVCNTTRGYIACNALYLFDCNTLMPLYIHIENSPDMPGAQTLDIAFSYCNHSNINAYTFSETQLIHDFSTVLSNYRANTYSNSTLIGSSAPMLSVTAQNGDKINLPKNGESPIILVFLKSGQVFTDSTISLIREAVKDKSEPVEICWIYVNSAQNNTLPATLQPNESLYYCNDSSLARYAIAGYPTVMVLTSQHIVYNSIVGYSPNMSKSIDFDLSQIIY